jgi:hypothetical protein
MTLQETTKNHSEVTPRASGRVLGVSLFSMVCCAIAASCGSKADDCGPTQSYDEAASTCVCLSGYVANGNSCVPCGVNEAAVAGVCTCVTGFARATPDEACLAVQPMISGDGGSSCASSTDCPGGYCDRTASPPLCRMPPTGQGTPCQADGDCAAFEANYCEAWVSKTCLVKDCSPSLNNCSDDSICCDFAAYNLPSLCVSRALNGDTCK